MKSINKKDLEVILEWFEKSSLTSTTIEYNESGGLYKIKLSRERNVFKHDAITVEKHVTSSSKVASPSLEHPSDITQGDAVISPIVGTFYRSSAPDLPPFVQVGDKVEKGDVICILEAMKVMNELEAEFDMEIVSILVENASLVEFEQVLFEVKAL